MWASGRPGEGEVSVEWNDLLKTGLNNNKVGSNEVKIDILNDA